MCRQQGTQAFNEVRLLQLAGADVDAHRDIQPGSLPAFHLGQGGINDPLADVNGQRMILDLR